MGLVDDMRSTDGVRAFETAHTEWRTPHRAGPVNIVACVNAAIVFSLVELAEKSPTTLVHGNIAFANFQRKSSA